MREYSRIIIEDYCRTHNTIFLLLIMELNLFQLKYEQICGCIVI